jgi:hypothetical protein
MCLSIVGANAAFAGVTLLQIWRRVTPCRYLGASTSMEILGRRAVAEFGVSAAYRFGRQRACGGQWRHICYRTCYRELVLFGGAVSIYSPACFCNLFASAFVRCHSAPCSRFGISIVAVWGGFATNLLPIFE